MGSCFLDLGTTDSKQTNEQIIDGTKSGAKNQDGAVGKRLGSSHEVGGQGSLPQVTCKPRSEKHQGAGTLQLNRRAFRQRKQLAQRPEVGRNLVCSRNSRKASQGACNSQKSDRR